MDAIKTAYATAYHRLLLLAKSGKIGNIVSVDATCTSTKEMERRPVPTNVGTASVHGDQQRCFRYSSCLELIMKKEASSYYAGNDNFDLFTKINFNYKNAVASVKVGKGVKAEGNLIIAGTKGYIYVPAPWWKTDYFEIRYENREENKRYFYQLDGEGIRY